MTLTVEEGKGYPLTTTNTKDNAVGLIPVDAIFSPIRNVAYKVEILELVKLRITIY